MSASQDLRSTISSNNVSITKPTSATVIESAPIEAYQLAAEEVTTWLVRITSISEQSDKAIQVSQWCSLLPELEIFLKKLYGCLRRRHNVQSVISSYPDMAQLLSCLTDCPIALLNYKLFAVLMKCMLWFASNKNTSGNDNLTKYGQLWAHTFLQKMFLSGLPHDLGFAVSDCQSAEVVKVIHKQATSSAGVSRININDLLDVAWYLLRNSGNKEAPGNTTIIFNALVIFICQFAFNQKEHAGCLKFIAEVGKMLQTSRHSNRGLDKSATHEILCVHFPTFERQVLNIIHCIIATPNLRLDELQKIVEESEIPAVCARHSHAFWKVIIMCWKFHGTASSGQSIDILRLIFAFFHVWQSECVKECQRPEEYFSHQTLPLLDFLQDAEILSDSQTSALTTNNLLIFLTMFEACDSAKERMLILFIFQYRWCLSLSTIILKSSQERQLEISISILEKLCNGKTNRDDINYLRKMMAQEHIAKEAVTTFIEKVNKHATTKYILIAFVASCASLAAHDIELYLAELENRLQIKSEAMRNLIIDNLEMLEKTIGKEATNLENVIKVLSEPT